MLFLTAAYQKRRFSYGLQVSAHKNDQYDIVLDMALILQEGDPLLREEAQEISKEFFNTSPLNEIVDKMKAALDAEPDGVALAAPQIGISQRIFIVRYDRLQSNPTGIPIEPHIGVYINAEFTRTSRKRNLLEEGCLSVRGTYGHTHRFERATVRAYDERGKVFERGAGGLLAQIFQHEIDHLNGFLFIDHAVDLYEYKRTTESGVVAEPTARTFSEPTTSPRFAYFGTPYVARDTLQLLHNHGFIPEVIITSPDSARGRGLALTPSETKAWALEHEIPVLTPETLSDEVMQEIMSFDCQYAIVVAYGKIIPQPLIEAFPMGILNVHYSLLPAYRGASPVESALLNGDTQTGVTIQKMVYTLDAGDIVAQEIVPIGPHDTALELKPKLIQCGAELLIKSLPGFYTGRITPVPQHAEGVTRAAKIKKEEGLLEIADVPNAHINWNKYRAYKESPGTYFFAEKNSARMRVKIREASFTQGVFTPTRIVPEGKTEQPFSYLAQNGWSHK
jgi:methionyl-tRNA formyltransferase